MEAKASQVVIRFQICIFDILNTAMCQKLNELNKL